MSSDTKRPQIGDTVFVPDVDGSWLSGIVSGYATDGRMLVGVRGHQSGAQAVVCATYLTDWCYPGDVGQHSFRPEQVERRYLDVD